MDLSDYVQNRMSIEPTRVFLEMQGEQLSSFKPILLRTIQYSREGNQLEQAIYDLARQARELNCKYVSNINVFGYSSFQPSGFSEGAFFYALSRTSAPSILLVGTGLIPKK